MSPASTPPSGQAPRRVLVLGDGGWGTAIAITLARAGHKVRLWSHDAAYVEEMRRSRANPRFLPGVELPPALRIGSAIAELAAGAEAVFSVIPTPYLRAAIGPLAPSLPAAPVISCTKGIERETLELPTRILASILPRARLAVLSGPSHAEEVSRQLPTAVVIAAAQAEDARLAQTLFQGSCLRVYTSDDVLGVELGGALKNVIAIAAGISDGLGFGDNSRSAIIARGLVEMSRLGLALGARRETFSGLSGLGDLITTCTSQHSRNRGVGHRIGRGERLADILASTRMVAEGVETSRSLLRLAQRAAVDMPISREVHAVLHEGKAPREAVAALMSRSARGETEDLV